MKMNKIFVSEYKGPNHSNGYCHFVVVVAAEDKETAKKHIFNKLSLDVEPVWLMNAKYPIIYTQDGILVEPVQAKILYNGNAHFKNW